MPKTVKGRGVGRKKRPARAPTRSPETTEVEPLLLNVEQTLRSLGIGRTMLWSLTTDGALRSVKIGARVFYRRRDLELFVERQARASTP